MSTIGWNNNKVGWKINAISWNNNKIDWNMNTNGWNNNTISWNVSAIDWNNAAIGWNISAIGWKHSGVKKKNIQSGSYASSSMNIMVPKGWNRSKRCYPYFKKCDKFFTDSIPVCHNVEGCHPVSRLIGTTPQLAGVKTFKIGVQNSKY